MDLLYKKTIKRAYVQDPKAVEKWLEKDYPKRHRRNDEIQWLDETGLTSQSNYI